MTNLVGVGSGGRGSKSWTWERAIIILSAQGVMGGWEQGEKEENHYGAALPRRRRSQKRAN